MAENVEQISLGTIAELACLLEVSAPKPGNVHRSADFEDLTFSDFLVSAAVLGQVIDAGDFQSVGSLVKTAVQRNVAIIGRNTNLGIILLLSPLLRSIRWGAICQKTVTKELKTLNGDDCEDVFEAIRIANPGGMGDVDQQDVKTSRGGQTDLLAAMKLAKDRDLIALQYTNGFAELFDFAIPKLLEGVATFASLNEAIVFAHVSLMANFPDSLIARKCGSDVAKHSSMLAAKALEVLDVSNRANGSVEHENYWQRISEMDFWLRSDGHRRNPGTTADMIAAALFVVIYDERLQPPFR